MEAVAVERAFQCDGVDRGFGREGVEAAAAQVRDLVDEHVARRAKFAPVARLAQDARGGIAATVAIGREADLDQRELFEVGEQRARVLARLQPHRARVGLAGEEAVECDRGFVMRVVGAEAEEGLGADVGLIGVHQ